MFGRFLRLDTPRFSSVPVEDIYEFFINYLDRLDNFVLIEPHDADIQYSNWIWLLNIGVEVI